MTAKELRQQRFAIVEEMRSLVADKFDAEKWNKLDADQKALESQIAAVERTEALEGEMRSVRAPQSGPIGMGLTQEPGAQSAENRAAKLRESPEYREAFRSYLRTGQRSKELIEMRAYAPLDNVTGADGADLVPIGFQKELETKLKAFGGIRNVTRDFSTTTGNTLQWPTEDDTTVKGQWLSVNTATPQANPTFGQVTFGANTLSSQQVLVPVQLIQDSAFDIESLLTDAFSIRLGRAEADAFVSGTGSGQPTGILSVAGTGNVTLAGAGSQLSGSTAINSIGFDDLANLVEALDPAYRKGATFVAAQSTFDLMRKLKDGFGRPLWEVSVTAGAPDSIYGYPYQRDQSMPAIGSLTKSVVFGNFSKYLVRRVGGIQVVRFNELYMPSYQVGFVAFERLDANCIQPAAFVVGQHPVS